MDFIQTLITSAIFGAVAAGALTFLFKNWISERLRQSISYEYSLKLENLKSDLNSRLESIRHEYEIHQLRTSLFFDHQRMAFAEILTKISETNLEWWRSFDHETRFVGVVPYEKYSELRNLFHRHRLFLESDSTLAMQLLFDVYEDSFPFDDGSGANPRQPDARNAYDTVEYIVPRLAALFQRKIGVAEDARLVRQLALLGAIKLLNSYHFPDLNLTAGQILKISRVDGPAEAVSTAERNLPQLLEKMQIFYANLREHPSFFHDAEARLGRYLEVLAGDDGGK